MVGEGEQRHATEPEAGLSLGKEPELELAARQLWYQLVAGTHEGQRLFVLGVMLLGRALDPPWRYFTLVGLALTAFLPAIRMARDPHLQALRPQPISDLISYSSASGWLSDQTYAATVLACSSVMDEPPFGGIGTPLFDSPADTPSRICVTISS